MNHVIFDVMNARVTFKNVPIHELSKFAFKDVWEMHAEDI